MPGGGGGGGGGGLQGCILREFVGQYLRDILCLEMEYFGQNHDI